MINRRVLAQGACAALAVLIGGSAVSAAEVNVYSARQEALISPVLEKFTAETGIAVNLITGKDGQLRERLVAEGRNSPADVLITADSANLYRAKEAGLLQPVVSANLADAVPARYRDSDNMWFGLSLRARVIVYAHDRVAPEELSTYEDLASPKWRHRVAVRSSTNVYNQSLIASLIAAHGADWTEDWARGLVANFARDPKGGDTDQIRAVAAGEADVALVNSYYYGRLSSSDNQADRDVVAATAIYFPNQRDRGTHVNISGAGVTASAKNREAAVRLIEFMASDVAQELFAGLNHEFPIRADLSAATGNNGWASFRADELAISVLGENAGEAIRLADRAGWR